MNNNNNNNNNNMNDNKNNNRKFGDDRSNAPRRPPPQLTTSNSNNPNPPRYRQTANRGNRGVGDIVAGQRGTAPARTGGNPPRTITGPRLTNSAIQPYVQPIVISNGRPVLQSDAPPNGDICFISQPNVGHLSHKRLLVGSVATTILPDAKRMVTASLGENISHFIFPEGLGLALRDRNFGGSNNLYLGGPGRILSDASLNIWLIFHVLSGVEDLGGTYLHLSCDESTRRSFVAGVGQDLDLDIVKGKALEFCANKNMLFAVGGGSPVIPNIVSDTDKKLAAALDAIRILERRNTYLTGRYTSAESALEESEAENRGLREEMGRHGNSLTMLSQPKRKNQDSDPDQSIKSSKH